MKHWNPTIQSRNAPAHAAEEARQAAHRRMKQRQREHERDERQDDMEAFADQIATTIIQAQQAEMKARLDELAEQNTAALMKNDQQLDAVRERISDLLAQAFVLPDGRRVFKTEDGKRVIDEFGQEVPPEVVDPDSIGDDRPSWQSYEGANRRETQLLEERERLLQEQQQIDTARENLDNGTLSPTDLDALEADLGPAELPDASPDSQVGRNIPALTPAPGT